MVFQKGNSGGPGRGNKGKGRNVNRAPEEVFEFGEVGEDELPADILRVLDELGDQISKVAVYRMTENHKQAWVGTIPADEFALDYVARRWGGGRYVARCNGPDGAFVKGVTFYIDESIRPERKDEPSAFGTDPLTKLLLDRVLAAPAAAAGNPMDLVASLAAASATQAQAMMTAMTPLLAKITELASGGGRGGDGNAADILQAVELGIGLGGKDEGYMPVIKEVGVPLVRALERMMADRGSGRHRVAVERGAADVAAPNVEPPAPAGPAWVDVVRPYVAKLLQFAERGDEPNLWAAVLDTQYPKFARWLDTAVVHPDFEAQLYGHFPELGPHRDWIHAFLVEFGPETDEAGELPITGEGGADGEVS